MRCKNANVFVRASSLLLWGAAASVVDDRCHAGGGRQNGDMWEREHAENRTGANMPHTLTKVNPITASATAPLHTVHATNHPYS